MGGSPCLLKTRSALLHGQLQEGLLDELLKASAVSGAQKYELCVAAVCETPTAPDVKNLAKFVGELILGGGSDVITLNNYELSFLLLSYLIVELVSLVMRMLCTPHLLCMSMRKK